MNFLLLSKKITPVFCPRLHLLLRRVSSSSPDPNRPFMVNDYLVSTFGFSPAKAAAISKPIAYLKSDRNPDAVRGFLQHQGFGEDETKTIIARCPSILCSSPQNTLASNLLALRNSHLSTSALTQIILSGPEVLQLRSAVPKINFWRDFLGGQEEALVKAFKSNRGLICHNVTGGISTKISLLQDHGISTHDIRWIMCNVPCFITGSVATMEETLKRAQDLGFHPKSGMFTHGLRAMACVTREALQKKMELYQSFGWSEEEFFSALRKAPNITWLSEENLRTKMAFLLGEAKCDLSYIISRPILLKYSLENRLRPRHHVLNLLESKNLCGKRKDFYNAISMSDNMFVAKYIVPHQEELPGLRDVYSGQHSVQI